MKLIKFVLALILALILGSTLAALVSLVVLSSGGVTFLILIGTAGIFAIVGLALAVTIGLPALWLLQHHHVTSLAAALSMTVGGAAVGALLTFGMFNVFALGAIPGASIGLFLAVLLYRPKHMRVVSRAP